MVVLAWRRCARIGSLAGVLSQTRPGLQGSRRAAAPPLHALALRLLLDPLGCEGRRDNNAKGECAMGHYTEFVLNVKLQSDMPAQAIDMLLFLSDQGTEPTVLPDHPFFSSTQWRDILIGLPPCGSMPHTSPVFKRDEDNGDEDAPYWLSVRSEFRNADQEIKKFMDWLLPLLDAMDGDFLGYQKRDYGTDEVTLYYFKETEPFQPDTARYLETIKIEEDYHIVKQ